ncbi:MAG: nitrous oxide reductase family maturation protein NosD [Candidatus Bipolaricaulia bacterium]
MKKTSKFGRVISVFVSFIILTLSFSVNGATLHVCKIGCEFSSIGNAINESASGDRIRIQNGNYAENLRIDKSITLVGANTRWVRITPSNPGSPALVVGPSSREVEITNVTVLGEGTRPENGITVTGDSRLTITNSRVNSFKKGLITRDSSYLKIRKVDVENFGVGVSGFDNSEVVVSGGGISSGKTGLIASDSSRITMVDTEVSSCSRNGLLVKETAKVNILSASITNNQAPGIVLKDYSRLTMEDTQVSSNESGGVLLTDSAIANLTDNQITYNAKKNVSAISKTCGFSGPSDPFFGEVNGANNEIKPVDSNTVCPQKFSSITSNKGGSYSYPLKPSTYAFIGLIGAATVFFLFSR